MEDRLNLVKRLVRSCTGTSFSIINLTKEKSEEFLNSTLNEIPVSSLISKNHLSIKPNMQSGCIYELRFVFDICCMSYYSIEEKTIYMLGPFLTKPDQKQETQ